MPTDVEYRISGLTKLDALELTGDPSFRLQENSIPDGTYGELTTITAYVAVSGIAALAAFLLKKHNGEEFVEEVEEVKPDGSIKRRVVKWKKSSTEAPDASIIKQIRGQL
jgi:hypothetical protein